MDSQNSQIPDNQLGLQALYLAANESLSGSSDSSATELIGTQDSESSGEVGESQYNLWRNYYVKYSSILENAMSEALETQLASFCNGSCIRSDIQTIIQNAIWAMIDRDLRDDWH